MKFAAKFTRTDTEVSWNKFVRWIGYSNLTNALQRKQASLKEALCLEAIVPKMYSIEIGLSQILKRWKTSRALQFPKEKSIYDGYSFVGSAVEIKEQLNNDQAAAFRSRVLADILPGGRLCNLEHEFRIAHNLHQFGWNIFHFGFCGDPGPDFIARRGSCEIEVEGKCLSPEVGLSVSFDFAARLLGRIGRSLASKHPGHFVSVKIELSREDRYHYDIDDIKRRAVESYRKRGTLEAGDFRIITEVERFDTFGARFARELKQKDAIDHIFSTVRDRQGDYGYFVRFENELVFLNLVPFRENRQVKNVLRLISATCERQFTKSRPSFLWLHLQALDANRMKGSPSDALPFMERLARYTFKSERRTHISSLIFSGDNEIEPKQYALRDRSVRGMESTGYVKGFHNPCCKFDHGPVFAPSLKTTET